MSQAVTLTLSEWILDLAPERTAWEDRACFRGRLEAFSDGVFAIAITLLVLEIPVPDVEHGGLSSIAASCSST